MTDTNDAVITEALSVIDKALAQMLRRELVSSGEVTDVLLDVRTLLTLPAIGRTRLLTSGSSADGPVVRPRRTYAPSMTDDSTDQHPEPVVVATYVDLGEAEVTKAHLSSERRSRRSSSTRSRAACCPSMASPACAVLVQAHDADRAREVARRLAEVRQ